MSETLSLLFWGVFCFSALVFVLSKYVLPKFQDILSAREAICQQGDALSKVLQEEIDTAVSLKIKTLHDAENEAKSWLQEHVQRYNQDKDQRLAEAKALLDHNLKKKYSERQKACENVRISQDDLLNALNQALLFK